MFLVFVFVCFCFWGFKGQVRWPKGPPHLALNPPHFCYFSFIFFVIFLSLLLVEKPSFSPKQGILVILQCLPLFLLGLFASPFFTVSFSVSVSLSLSLSLVLFFLPSFLPSCLSFFAFFWFLVFVSFFICLSSWLLFHEKYNIKTYSTKLFSSILSLVLVFCLVLLSNPFFLSLFFSWFYVVFLVQHECF